jgi:adenine phosphoribosyltransferase
MDFSKYIRHIPDYPKKGIIFYDITTLLSNAEAFCGTVDAIVARYQDAGITKVAGVEARGFILGAAVAYAMKTGFVPIRKKGKLPWETYSAEYDLEYGTDIVEIHKDALLPTDKVLVVDDMLATGGTAKAVLELAGKCGVPDANIHFCFLMDIADVNGAAKDMLKKHGYVALI